jgi:D-3-phosphoglycerate dehydrogenase / 2-oxoglutarate reductase
MKKVLITTIPFGARDKMPLELLDDNNIEYTINPYKRKIKESELAELIPDYDGLIAGTETISQRVLDNANNLKIISRVGIGLDGLDLLTARAKNILVTYTPDAPAPAVAELTLGLMICLLRNIHVSNAEMHKGGWERHFGRRIADITIGIIGAGRIGQRVLRRTKSFGTPKILVNDLITYPNLEREFKLHWVTKDTIYRQSDIISLHLPLTTKTRNMITRKEMYNMKLDAMLINTSRGGIINEQDLFEVLKKGHLQGAAIDVFENEPYDGPLKELDNCILTSHMGSMTLDCRSRMEIEATREIVNFFSGNDLSNMVPEFEYELKKL